MYLAIWLAGYKTYGLRVATFPALTLGVAASMVAWKLCSQAYGIPAMGLQRAKFPPHLMYFIASCPSMLVALWFRRSLGKRISSVLRPVGFLGRNALMFYLSQGIGASMLFRVVPLTEFMPTPARLALCFALNVMVSVILGCALLCTKRVADRVRGLFSK